MHPPSDPDGSSIDTGRSILVWMKGVCNLRGSAGEKVMADEKLERSFANFRVCEDEHQNNAEVFMANKKKGNGNELWSL